MEHFDTEIYQLVVEMMAADPSKRPEASALLEKGIFQSVVETD